jgi:hypothetical protein
MEYFHGMHVRLNTGKFAAISVSMRIPSLIPLFFLILAAGCAEEKPEQKPTSPQGPLTTVPEAPRLEDRDDWQRPHELVSMMINTLKERNTVAHLFAGDGYYTFYLVDGGMNVIAIDSDPQNIALLEAEKARRGLGDDRLRIRQVQPGETGLSKEEVDAVLIVHQFTRIGDRAAFFEKVRDGMRFPRPLFMIEWQNKETPLGPPVDQRMPTERIMDELGSYGFYDVGAHSNKMPWQVVFFASDPMEMDEAEYQREMENVRVRVLE